jgi:hypothetical protein
VVPSSAGSLFGLLLVLAPGIWYELIRQRSRPGRADSTFVEVSRILLAGVLVSLTVLILLGLIRAINPHLLDDPQALLSQPSYLAAHLGTLVWTLVWFLVFAMTIPAAWLYNTPGKTAHEEIRQESLWVSYFDRIPRRAAATKGLPPFEYVYVQVRTEGDVLYRGRLAGYDNSPDLDGRELTISGPNLITKPVGEEWSSLEREGWSVVIIPGDEIKDIHVLYYTSPGRDLPLTSLSRMARMTRRFRGTRLGKLVITTTDRRWLGLTLGLELLVSFLVAVATR